MYGWEITYPSGCPGSCCAASRGERGLRPMIVRGLAMGTAPAGPRWPGTPVCYCGPRADAGAMGRAAAPDRQALKDERPGAVRGRCRAAPTCAHQPP